MNGPWKYQAKQNKSDRKSQETYYTHVWDIKLKATNEPRRQTKTPLQIAVWLLPEGRGVKSKGDQIHGDKGGWTVYGNYTMQNTDGVC